MKNVLALSYRVFLVPLCAALFLSACGSSSNSSTPRVSAPNGYEWRVTIRNQTDHYMWVSRYWTTHYTGWHVEGSNCIGPHDETTQAITFSTGLFAPEGRIRAEIKPISADRKNCDGENEDDVTSTSCKFDFSVRDVYRGDVKIYYLNGAWRINVVCHSGPD